MRLLLRRVLRRVRRPALRSSSGAIIGGPVGAVIGAGVGGVAGGIAEQNSRMQPPAGTVVVPSDATTTGSIRQRTCIEDAYGNLSCRNVIR